jgi:hypothetical protein
MTDPAKVYKVQNGIASVEIPIYSKLSRILLNEVDITDKVANVSFQSKSLKMHKFGKSMVINHEVYHDMKQEYLDRDYEMFYDELVDNCKTLFIQDPIFTHRYDAMRHEDVVSWSVLAGSEQFDFFKDLFKAPPEIVEVEKRVYIPTYPNTLRECFKRAWVLIKARFKK